MFYLRILVYLVIYDSGYQGVPQFETGSNLRLGKNRLQKLNNFVALHCVPEELEGQAGADRVQRRVRGLGPLRRALVRATLHAFVSRIATNLLVLKNYATRREQNLQCSDTV